MIHDYRVMDRPDTPTGKRVHSHAYQVLIRNEWQLGSWLLFPELYDLLYLYMKNGGIHTWRMELRDKQFSVWISYFNPLVWISLGQNFLFRISDPWLLFCPLSSLFSQISGMFPQALYEWKMHSITAFSIQWSTTQKTSSEGNYGRKEFKTFNLFTLYFHLFPNLFTHSINIYCISFTVSSGVKTDDFDIVPTINSQAI